MRALLFALVAVATACITPPPPFERAPKPAHYAQDVKAWFERNLLDPASLRIRDETQLVEARCYETGIGYSPALDGWAVAVVYNAKNSFGGMTQFKTAVFLFEGDHVTYIQGPCYYPDGRFMQWPR